MVWGHDAAFLALAAPTLAVEDDGFAAGRVLAAEIDGVTAGVAVVLPPHADGGAEPKQLVVEPRFLRRSVGAKLRGAAVAMARHDVDRALRALADPQAQAFCERLGFRQIAEAPSDAIAGQMLQPMEHDIREDG